MATATARADLEVLLRARRLDRTVPSTLAVPGVDGVPTGIPGLDARLGTGLPRGELSEMTGPRSSGRGSLVQSALAALTRQEGLAALVDPLDMFDPLSAADAGLALDRLLWVRGEALSEGRADVLLDRGLKALNLVLQAGGFDLVVFDLAEAPHAAIRRLPFTTWFRLQRAIEGSRTACLLTGRGPIARSAGGVSIQLTRAAGRSSCVTGPRVQSPKPEACGGTAWVGNPARPRLFAGLEIEARVIRARDPEPSRIELRIEN